MTAAKAVASGIVTLAAYLIGVIPAEGGFGDVSVVQWLGALIALGASYGVTYQVSNRPRPSGPVVTPPKHGGSNV